MAPSAATSAWSPPVTTNWIGPIAPGLVACAARSKPTRVSKSFGNWAIAALSSLSESAGEAISSISTVAPIANGSGRFISALVQRSQKPGPSFATFLRRSRPTILPGSLTRLPSTAISAGSSVTAANTAIATTTIAPTAIERTTVASIRNSPASATITVTPEKTTAMPEVRIAASRASSWVSPALNSSR